jgi:uncharacterized membrane protein YoaK (UPF0700 family)
MSDVQALRAIAVSRPIPVVLSLVAGYVDSCTYRGLFGAFVAQVTGSFVFAGAFFASIDKARFRNCSPFRFSSSPALV